MTDEDIREIRDNNADLVNTLSGESWATIWHYYLEDGVTDEATAKRLLLESLDACADWTDAAMKAKGAHRAFIAAMLALWATKPPMSVVFTLSPEPLRALSTLLVMIYSLGYANGHEAGELDHQLDGIIRGLAPDAPATDNSPATFPDKEN